ncbi:hypothetical protein [Methylobacterium gregans]|uniref:Uncharacterized protein n=1 Tax=Methylobacterium gregans TaxID=374424 RepID=A0AA37MCT8_9HYPH|nr:hypothetical protein [Methylobacterium gregans]MDQ0519906.1 hypothetical protein [Methylobacterium gregans]GJD79844.1 hypothetical protein NBEOAGPD_3074 [Methylobacterium gregans]GLS53974.1 hypothetical protein GCM10007886_21570 [Methylobacterium gregans]
MKPFRSALTGAAALALLGCLTGAARADAVPNLDIEKTCKSAGRVDIGSSATEEESRNGCLRSEREARKEAERRWSNYTPAAKKQCQSQFQAGGYPSYVEMVTCLELASGTVPTQTGAAGTAVGGPGSAKGQTQAPQERKQGTSTLTQEPAPSERTNPIQVLERK